MKVELTDESFSRGLKALGSIGRLSALLNNLEIPIVYGAIGGSITQGAAADPLSACYVSRFGEWLDHEHPAGCTTINAGIGASNSLFGVFRARRDLLDHKPDIITIEYAVNDLGGGEIERGYEALVRKCLAQDNSPAVILLFTMRRNGENRQEEHMRIGMYYNVPMLSYRDAVWPDIEEGRHSWEDLSPDEVHPNNDGHGFIAEMLKRLAEEAKATEQESAAPSLPERLNPESEKFSDCRVVDADLMTVMSNRGWTTGPHKGGYTGFQSKEPGAELTLTFRCRFASLGYKKYAGDFGRLEILLDDEEPVVLEGYYERPPIQAWAGGHTVLHTLVDSAESIEHKLRIRLLTDKHPESRGHMFDIGYLLLGH